MRIRTLLLSLLMALPAAAKTHFNSKQRILTDASASPQFHSIVLADMNGDGLKETVGFTQDINGFEISVGTSGYPTSVIARFDSHGVSGWLNADGSAVLIDQVIVGKFTSTARDNFCFRSRTPAYYGSYARAYCFEVSGSTLVQSSGSGFTVPTMWLAGRAQLTGDFDGDGYDELLTYDPSTGTDARMWEWNQLVGGYIDYGFSGKTDFDAANLASVNSPGGIVMYAGNFANFSGEGVRDDLLVYNVSTRDSWVFHSRLSGGKTVFWALFGPWGPLTSGAEEISIADADGDGFEDLITHDVQYGNNRFRSLQTSTLLSPLPYAHPDSGNLPTFGAPNETHLYFGKMSYFWGEGGHTNTRDDVWLYDVAAGTYRRFDARYCDPSWYGCPSYGEQTYWAWFDEYRTTMFSNLQMSYGGVP